MKWTYQRLSLCFSCPPWGCDRCHLCTPELHAKEHWFVSGQGRDWATGRKFDQWDHKTVACPASGSAGARETVAVLLADGWDPIEACTAAPLLLGSAA